MSNYEWVCQACKHENLAANMFCSACGCPSDAPSIVTDIWLNDGLDKPGIDPKAFALYGEFWALERPMGKCPECSSEISIYTAKCWACGSKYDPDTRVQIVLDHRRSFDKAKKFALPVFITPFVLVGLYEVFKEWF